MNWVRAIHNDKEEETDRFFVEEDDEEMLVAHYLRADYFAPDPGSHSGELCDKEPIVTLRRLLKAALLLVGQPDLAPWCLTEAAPLASSSSASTAFVGDSTHP
jgi:hypothetical protein